MEERMMDDNDMRIIQADKTEGSVDMPLKIDSLYDMVTCNECGIGLPFEWILSHLKKNHGIKTQMVDVMRYLDMFGPSMRLQEAKEWIKSTWMAKAIQNVPVRSGFACNLCQHCTCDMKPMQIHFSNHHRGLKASENSQKCTIQMPFKGELHKYIQVDEFEDEMMQIDADEDDAQEWNQTLEQEFEESIGRIDISENNKNDDLRLMGLFVAKTRWDLAVKDMDKKALMERAAAPTIKDRLHKIILCGRRYIQQCNDRMSNGNIIIRRLLMSGGYIDRYKMH
jgi:hypothetical protein